MKSNMTDSNMVELKFTCNFLQFLMNQAAHFALCDICIYVSRCTRCQNMPLKEIFVLNMQVTKTICMLSRQLVLNFKDLILIYRQLSENSNTAHWNRYTILVPSRTVVRDWTYCLWILLESVAVLQNNLKKHSCVRIFRSQACQKSQCFAHSTVMGFIMQISFS